MLNPEAVAFVPSGVRQVASEPNCASILTYQSQFPTSAAQQLHRHSYKKTDNKPNKKQYKKPHAKKHTGPPTAYGVLFAFPWVVREKIWRELLKPENSTYCVNKWTSKPQSTNAVGCTTALILNKTIYSEVIDILLEADNYLYLSGDDRKLFRHPLAHGKPNFFHAEAKASAVAFPTGLSEIEFAGLRKIEVSFKWGMNRWGKSNGGLLKHIEEMVGAVEKSGTMKEMNLTIQCKASSDREYILERAADELAQVVDAIRPLIELAIIKQIILKATEDQCFKVWPSRRKHEVEWIETYHDPVVEHINDHQALQVSNAAVIAQSEKLKHPEKEDIVSIHEFELVPECRKCKAVFKTQGELKNHLETAPTHQVKFIKYRENRIHRFAESGGSRHACLVCARSYHGRAKLDEHIEKEGHDRDPKMGIVGRYVKDNGWYNSVIMAGQVEAAYEDVEHHGDELGAGVSARCV